MQQTSSSRGFSSRQRAISIAAIIVIVIAALASIEVIHRSDVAGSSSTSTSITNATTHNGCVDGSDETSGITCAYLEQQAVVWKPATNSSIGWSVMDNGASYDNLETTPYSQLTSEAGMLASTGASCIRLDVGYDAWLNNNVTAQNEVTSLVNMIRNYGKCLIIADASAEYYRNNPLTWSRFQVAWVSRVTFLARMYQPNFYEVVKEPGWYVPMVSDANTNPQFSNVTVWVQLTQNLTNAVHSVSPSTKVGIAIQGGISSSAQPFYVSYLKQVSQMSGIDFIGYDQYGANDQSLDLAIENQVQTTKAIWIAETWSTDAPSIVFNPDRASLDAYWIQVEYYYALYIHASNIEPFYTEAFASYTQPPNYSQKTPVFYEFQHLATTYAGVVS